MKLGTKILLGISCIILSPILLIGAGAFAGVGIYYLIEKDDMNPLITFIIAVAFESAWLIGVSFIIK